MQTPIIGSETGLKTGLERARLVARSDVPVLILGETGSGKEVFARYIHEQSQRAGNPFLKVNCGAVPPELIDSYLFGHRKGAFTGAIEERKGWFETANGGTLLLDEVGELSLAVQVRFLRVLQDGCFEPVGGGSTVRADVRIIAATHRNLRQMIRNSAFREDLWFRISVFPIRIPPLRERLEDIGKLTRFFVRRAAAKFHLAEVSVTPNDVEVLSRYPFPGNVRELGAVIDRAVLLGQGVRLPLIESLRECRGEQILPELPIEILTDAGELIDGNEPLLAEVPIPTQTAADETAEFYSLDDAVRRHIRSALAISHGVVEGTSGAAALLQINPHTLRAKMRRLGIDWTQFRDQ
ncbi:MAG: sigma 54-interacting transcriptional regulator [Planctomycetaceae bacterium]|jgi:transcriptional regulator with GAF, ATPase, and Fis domain|nr:sigma 54-interacting transcriptional regulator [Planctomycetaceae bacterium]